MRRWYKGCFNQHRFVRDFVMYRCSSFSHSPACVLSSSTLRKTLSVKQRWIAVRAFSNNSSDDLVRAKHLGKDRHLKTSKDRTTGANRDKELSTEHSLQPRLIYNFLKNLYFILSSRFSFFCLSFQSSFLPLVSSRFARASSNLESLFYAFFKNWNYLYLLMLI